MGVKPPQAAVVKSHGRERWGRVQGILVRVCVSETSESKPSDDASLGIKVSSKSEASATSEKSLPGDLSTGQAAIGVKGA